MVRIIRLCVFLSVAAACASAQTPGTGLYALGSFDSRGFDSINLGNLNTHFEIPIVSKQGRGLPFNYSLVYDGLVWSAVAGSGSSYWQPDTSWGFHGSLDGTGLTGYMTYDALSGVCSVPNHYGNIYQYDYTNYVYHDPYGANHAFNYHVHYGCPVDSNGNPTNAQPQPSGDGSSRDDSGYTFNGSSIFSRSGATINAPYAHTTGSSGTIADTNGNTITKNGDGSFTDTLGVTELSVQGSGTAGSPRTFTYPVTNQQNGATTAAVTVAYTTYRIMTNFGCGGTDFHRNDVYNADLPSRVTLADGSSYSLSYEATPGGPGGAVTGRLASITLPTGGQISYSYSGGCGGGINTDGTPGTLTRATSDGTRTYTRATVNGNATSTTLQDEKGNNTVLQFTVANGLFYETHRQVYQGAVGNSLLMERNTCYNRASPSCDGLAVTSPITEADVTTSYNRGFQDLTKNYYDVSGNPTGSGNYDSGGSLIQNTTNTYNGNSEVLSSVTTDVSGAFVAKSTYGYDEAGVAGTSGIPQHGTVSGARGNQTSSHIYYDPSHSLNSSATYYDTGVPVASMDAGGSMTQYSYDPTQTFNTLTLTSIQTPNGYLGTSASYDKNSGAVLTSVGMNSSETTTFNIYDGRLRPTTMTLPTGGQIAFWYMSPNETLSTWNWNGVRNGDEYDLYDSYGRMSRTEVDNGQSSNNWYQVDTCYDQTGLVKFVSTRYQGPGFSAPIRCSGSGTAYQYDALGRVTSVQTDDGTATTSYWNRSVLTTDVNGVQRLTQYDGMGRIANVCEISSGPGNSTCGNILNGYYGLLTTYDYDLAGHQTTIKQGAQIRIFQTDAAGRTTYTHEPERGDTNYSYSYNATGLQMIRTRPRANQGNSGVLTQTTTQFDSLGRTLSVSYNDGITPNKSFFYDSVPGGQGWTQGVSNARGRLVATSSGSGATLARSLMSYDNPGHVTTLWECAPSICGGSSQSSRPAIQTLYDLAGFLTYEFDGASGGIRYGRSPAAKSPR